MEDTSTSQCVLGARRLRQTLKYALFGAAVLWILFGNYGSYRAHSKSVSRTKRDAVQLSGTRSLMNVEPDQCHYDPQGHVDIEVSRPPEIYL